MKRDLIVIENRIKFLRAEIQKIKRQRVEFAGKIALKYFTKESDFTSENLTKFTAEFKAFLTENPEAKNVTGK
jgi:uracil-DNA glycosylase